MLRGTSTPELRGISWPIRDLKQYKTALLVMDRGVLVLASTSLPVPVKSNTAVLWFLSIVNLS